MIKSFLQNSTRKAVKKISYFSSSEKAKKLTIASKYFLMIMLFSFMGCIMETIVCAIPNGIIYDCGFLTLPFCPIYGICIILIFLLLGTPKKKRGVLKNFSSPSIKNILYLTFSFIIPTVAELIIGVFADKVLGVRLWHYYDYPLNFYGYICLPVSLAWTVMIPLFMRFVFTPIEKLYLRIPDKAARISAYILGTLMAVDFITNIILLILGKDLLAAYLFHIYQ